MIEANRVREFLETGEIPLNFPTDSLLLGMQAMGSSVDLNWDEDTDLWECSWITSGERFTGFSKNPNTAARQAVLKVHWARRDR